MAARYVHATNLWHIHHAMEWDMLTDVDAILADDWEAISPEPPNRVEIVECCPHCERENVLEWNVEKYGLHAFCAYCGETLMLCSACPDLERDATVDCAKCPHEKGRGRKAAVKTMTFQEAKKRLHEGKKVTRLAFATSAIKILYAWLLGRSFYKRYPDGLTGLLTLTTEDIDATDWVEVDEEGNHV